MWKTVDNQKCCARKLEWIIHAIAASIKELLRFRKILRMLRGSVCESEAPSAKKRLVLKICNHESQPSGNCPVFIFFLLSKNLKSSKGIRKARSSKNNIKKFQETIAAELAEQLAAQLARLFASQLAKRCSGSTLQCLHKRPLLRSSFAAVPTE